MTPETSPSDAEIPPEAAPYEYPTWEDDETRATGVLRALCTLVAAGFLAYAQWMAPANWPGTIGQNWGRWVWTSAVCNFALPVLMVWMFFGQGLTFQEWLKDQKHNGWNYGWNTLLNWHELKFSLGKRTFSLAVVLVRWENRARHLKIALICWLIFLPFLLYFSRNPDMRAAYANYLPAHTTAKEWAFLLGSLVVYMFCWEWFFRGFTLFGIAQGFGFIAAIGLQAALFGLAHLGKPSVEMGSAFAGGLVLGTLSWREKSFFPGLFNSRPDSPFVGDFSFDMKFFVPTQFANMSFRGSLGMTLRRSLCFLVPLVSCLAPLTGCAKSPSGGPVNNAPNRLQVTLNIRGNLASNAYYAVAFDDDSTRRGPIAITSGSSANDAVIPLNGVVGGSFRVMVLYNNNNFTVFRRPDPNSPNVEIIERSSTPFVGGLSPRASTNAINFTLNLDARAGDGSFYFPHDQNGVLTASVLNLNAFATTRPFINSRDLRIKPVDALGQSTTSTPERFLIGGTRIASINDFFGDNNDRNPYDASFNNTTDPDYVNFRQLDISSLDLNVTRSN